PGRGPEHSGALRRPAPVRVAFAIGSLFRGGGEMAGARRAAIAVGTVIVIAAAVWWAVGRRGAPEGTSSADSVDSATSGAAAASPPSASLHGAPKAVTAAGRPGLPPPVDLTAVDR